MKELRSLIVEIDGNGKSHITAKCPFCEDVCVILIALRGCFFLCIFIIIIMRK